MWKSSGREVVGRSANEAEISAVVDCFNELLTYDAQMEEMIQAHAALEGGEATTTPNDVVMMDVIRIISVVSRANGEDVMDTSIFDALRRELEAGFALTWHGDAVEILLRASEKHYSVAKPTALALLKAYDELQQTALAEKASDAYRCLVLTLTRISEKETSIPMRLVVQKYEELFA